MSVCFFNEHPLITNETWSTVTWVQTKVSIRKSVLFKSKKGVERVYPLQLLLCRRRTLFGVWVALHAVRMIVVLDGCMAKVAGSESIPF